MVEYGDQTENKRYAVALACDAALALNLITAMNGTIVYRNFLIQMYCRIR